MYRGCQTAATFDGTLDWKRAWLADPKVDGVRALLLPLGGQL